MGVAYTMATVTKFNGFSDVRDVFYIDSEAAVDSWQADGRFGLVFAEASL